MQVSIYILIAALEVYLVLILISLFVLLHSRTQKRLITRQQAKILELLHSHEVDPKNPSAALIVTPPTSAENYKAQLTQQLSDTLNYFRTISDGDITLPQPPESSQLQKATALRYQFLQAEDVAICLQGAAAIDWNLVEQHLIPLLPHTQDETNLETELAACKKRIENLERFKQLFFNMEKQWQEAQQKAQGYHVQLSEMSEAVDDKAYFNDILERYHNVYSDVNESIVSGRRGDSVKNTNPEIGQATRNLPNAANEIIKLRNVAVDQHRIINQLQRKLENAHTAAEKEGAITELQQQLHRQIRFVQEAETCIQLLEDELARSHEKLTQQEQQLENVELLQEENLRIREALGNFVLESKELVTTISQLEHEKETLKAKLSSGAHNADNPAQKEALKKSSHDLLILQTRYAELEEAYLDLKLKNPRLTND